MLQLHCPPLPLFRQAITRADVSLPAQLASTLEGIQHEVRSPLLAACCLLCDTAAAETDPTYKGAAQFQPLCRPETWPHG